MATIAQKIAAVGEPAGSSGTPLYPAGNLNVQVSAAGNGNAAATTDTVLFVYTLPANAFDQAGRQLNISTCGSLATNGNSKRAKVYFGCTSATVGQVVSGGTVIADTLATTGSNVGWSLSSQITKYGAGGSNTQLAESQPIVGTTHGGISGPIPLTAPENAPIIIAVTGSSAASAANDVLAQLLDVSFSD